MNLAERYWIAEIDSLSPNGYNLTEGGGEGGRRTKETRDLLREVFSRPSVREKRSRAMKEVQNRLEMKEIHRKTWLGKKRSDEDRHKMSERKLAKKYRWKIDPVTGCRVYWSEA
jgi:hypothetical protein